MAKVSPCLWFEGNMANRVMQAMLKMKKAVIADLEAAYNC
jgi:predicted 3-demethylubiquinone-9 3-methyltransferase (glyoxalase superfamily)